MNLSKYCSAQQWQKIQAVANDKPSPFLVVDLKKIEQKYQELCHYFPDATVFYAVKANPGVEVIQKLNQLNASFDVASVYELDKVLQTGVSASRLSYGNTIKKKSDIAYAYQKGVRTFVTDAMADLQQIAEAAPRSKVFVRVIMESGDTAEWPLSRKFGCDPAMCVALMMKAKELGLEPYGVSFHVGSQQKDVAVWTHALDKVKDIFEQLDQEHQIKLEMINLGGGFPAQYVSAIHSLQTYAQHIYAHLDRLFPQQRPILYLEPGRSLVGDSGVIVSEIVLISKKSTTDHKHWVYTDVGVFNGLIETLGENIKYPIYTPKMTEDSNHIEVVLAGPTCDSADIMYENKPYFLPQSVDIGDRLYWLSTGAYTSSYASVEFNGYPPLKTYYIE